MVDAAQRATATLSVIARGKAYLLEVGGPAYYSAMRIERTHNPHLLLPTSLAYEWAYAEADLMAKAQGLTLDRFRWAA